MRQMTRDLFNGVSEHSKAGKHRMEDARALMKEKRWRGALYIAGYVIECLLKTKLMRIFDCRNLRELEEVLQMKGLLSEQRTIFTHQLEALLRLVPGWERLRQKRNQGLWQDFNIVNTWMPAWRYSADQSKGDDAHEFLEAVGKIALWIEHNV